MNKTELIDALAAKTGFSKDESKQFLESYIEIMTKCLAQKEDVVLVGFGTMSVWEQTQRLARNPKTGVPVMIQPRTSIKFKPGKFLLEALNENRK